MSDHDPTEGVRRVQQAVANTVGEALAEAHPEDDGRAALEQVYGKVYDTSELQAEFTVIGFLAPYCVVERKSDGVRGSITFQHSPRFYFDFVADTK